MHHLDPAAGTFTATIHRTDWPIYRMWRVTWHWRPAAGPHVAGMTQRWSAAEARDVARQARRHYQQRSTP